MSSAANPITLDEAKIWARIGVLAALALVLSYIETFIPVPVPIAGIKLGLANIVILVALKTLDFRSAAAIAAIKVLASGFLFGSPLMIAYSAAGTLLALLGMAVLAKVKTLHVAMVAILGAILHNVGQLAVAQLMLQTALVWLNLPILAAAAVATGALSGAATAFTLTALAEANLALQPPRHTTAAATAQTPTTASAAVQDPTAATTSKVQSQSVDTKFNNPAPPATSGQSRSVGALDNLLGLNKKEEALLKRIDARAKLIALLAYFAFAFLAPALPGIAFTAAIAIALAIATKLTPKRLLKALRPLTAILIITVAAQIATTQTGTALLEVGTLTITAEALEESAVMLIRLASVLTASTAFMRTTNATQLTRAFESLTKPLAALGLNPNRFILALNIAFTFIPVLAAQFQALRRAHASRLANFEDGGVRQKLAAYQRLFAPLIVSSFRRADQLAQACVARNFACGHKATKIS